MSGELSVLSCSAGDIRVKVDPKDPVTVERAKKMIQDMLKRGYLLAIEIDGKLEMVKEFDPKTGEYIIIESVTAAEEEPTDEPVTSTEPVAKRGRGRPKRIPMTEAKVTGVPRTAGG